MGTQYDRTAMVFALDSVLHRQFISFPPLKEIDLRNIDRVYHFNRAAVAKALESIRGKRFYISYNQMTGMESLQV